MSICITYLTLVCFEHKNVFLFATRSTLQNISIYLFLNLSLSLCLSALHILLLFVLNTRMCFFFFLPDQHFETYLSIYLIIYRSIYLSIYLSFYLTLQFIYVHLLRLPLYMYFLFLCVIGCSLLLTE